MHIPYESLRKYHIIAHKVRNVVLNEKQRCFNTNWAKGIFDEKQNESNSGMFEGC